MLRQARFAGPDELRREVGIVGVVLLGALLHLRLVAGHAHRRDVGARVAVAVGLHRIVGGRAAQEVEDGLGGGVSHAWDLGQVVASGAFEIGQGAVAFFAEGLHSGRPDATHVGEYVNGG